jgi:hypothetical protein
MGERALTAAEKQRRYRARKFGNSAPVTKPDGVTKPSADVTIDLQQELAAALEKILKSDTADDIIDAIAGDAVAGQISWNKVGVIGKGLSARFKTVIIDSAIPTRYPKIIGEHFADAEWYPLADIAEKLGAPDEAAAERSLYGMEIRGSVDIERRLRGRDQHTEYRIFLRKKTVSAIELAKKLDPLIKELKIEGKKSMATMVPANVAMIASLLQRLRDEWAA